MTARKLQPFMRNIAIYERIGEGVQRRYRVRLLGSGIVQFYGELTGKSFEDAIPANFLPRWYAISDVPLLSHKPVRYVCAPTPSTNPIWSPSICARRSNRAAD